MAETQVAFAGALAARDQVLLAGESVTLARRLDEAAGRRFDAGAATLLERNLAGVRLGQARRSRLAASLELPGVLTTNIAATNHAGRVAVACGTSESKLLIWE